MGTWRWSISLSVAENPFNHGDHHVSKLTTASIIHVRLHTIMVPTKLLMVPTTWTEFKIAASVHVAYIVSTFTIASQCIILCTYPAAWLQTLVLKEYEPNSTKCMYMYMYTLTIIDACIYIYSMCISGSN